MEKIASIVSDNGLVIALSDKGKAYRLTMRTEFKDGRDQAEYQWKALPDIPQDQ